MVSVCDSGGQNSPSYGAIPPIPLLARVHDTIPVKHFNTSTRRVRCDWIKRFVNFDGKGHPSGLGEGEVVTVLTQLDQMFD